MFPDLYAILQVRPDASDEEIKTSYRKLAFQFHPDRNPGNSDAEEFFKIINLSYEILGNPAKREWYNNQQQGQQGPFGINKQEGKRDKRKYGNSKQSPLTAQQREALTLRRYSEMVKRFPIVWRIGIPAVLMLWAFQQIFSHWFVNEAEFDVLISVLSWMVFSIATYFFANALYLKMQQLQALKKFRLSPENTSLAVFVVLVVMCPFLVWGLNNYRKSYHLNHYAATTVAHVVDFEPAFSISGERAYSLVYEFDFNGSTIQKKETFRNDLLYKLDDRVLVKFSTYNPRICVFVQKVDY